MEKTKEIKDYLAWRKKMSIKTSRGHWQQRSM